MNVSVDVYWEKLNSTLNRTLWYSEGFAENSTYSNDQASSENSVIKSILNILAPVSVVLAMISMGSEISREELLHHIKRPIGISIGMFSQFVVLPLSAFSLLQCVSVSGIHGTGVLLTSCCPGGALSNIFAYFCDGDLSLSVSMTTLSTLIAIGMMPLNLWMYGRIYETEGVIIPYLKLFLSLVFITSSVGVGMLLRWKIPRITNVVAKAFVYISVLILIIYLFLQVMEVPDIFSKIPGKLYAVIMILPVIGFSLGYVLALVFRRNTAVRRTIALECGVQNVPTALAMITLSFPAKIQEDMVSLPYMYSVAMVSAGLVFCSLYQAYKKCIGKKTVTQEPSAKKRNNEAGTSNCQEVNADEPMLKPSKKEIPMGFDCSE